MSKLNEVLKLLIDLNPMELRTVAKEAKDRGLKIIRDTIKQGDTVKIPRDQNNTLYVVTKVNIKNFVIKDKARNVSYNCHPALLELVEDV